MTIYHTSKFLRSLEMLVEQDGDSFRLVDWETYKPVSKAREKKYWDAVEKDPTLI